MEGGGVFWPLKIGLNQGGLATGLSFVRPKQAMPAKKLRNTPSGAEALCKFPSIQGSKDPCSLRYEQITGRQHKCEQALVEQVLVRDTGYWIMLAIVISPSFCALRFFSSH